MRSTHEASCDAAIRANRRTLAGIAALLFACSLVCWMLAKTTGLFPRTGLQPGVTRASLPTAVMKVSDFETSLASPATAFAVVVTLAVFAAREAGPRMATAVLLSPLVVVITAAAKNHIGAPTPLPSGHAAYAMAVFGMGAWLFYRAGSSTAAALFAVVALAMGPLRVIAGAHFVSDVVVGVALGLAWLIALVVLGTPPGVAQDAPLSTRP